MTLMSVLGGHISLQQNVIAYNNNGVKKRKYNVHKNYKYVIYYLLILYYVGRSVFVVKQLKSHCLIFVCRFFLNQTLSKTKTCMR